MSRADIGTRLGAGRGRGRPRDANVRNLGILPAVQPGERVRYWHAAAALGCVAAAAVLARSAGTALLLDAFDARLLPWLYAGAALLVMAAAWTLGSLMRRARPDRVVMLVALGIVAACLAVRIGVDLGRGFSAAAYVLADAIARILVALFWGLAALAFNAREAKRLLGPLGAAGTIACFLAAAAIPAITPVIGTKNLLLIVAALVAGFIVVIRSLVRREPASLTAGAGQTVGGVSSGSNVSLLGVPLVRHLGLLVALSTLALVLNDFVFLSAVRTLHSGDGLAAFLGRFYAVSSALALGVQLFVLPWLLRAGGVLAGLVALPAVLLLGTGAVAATGALPLIVVAKMVEPVLLFTVDAAAIHLLYQGLQKRSRFRARTLVDGVGRPAALALAAMALLAGAADAPTRVLAGAIAMTCAAWLIVAWMSARSYVHGLIGLLGAHGLDLGETELSYCDPALAEHLRKRLREAPDDEMPYLLALVRDAPGDWTEEHATLLQRQSSELRVAGIEHLASQRATACVPALRGCLTDPAAPVRAAAVTALVALDPIDGPSHVESLLRDASPEVRARAASALLEQGDLDAVVESAQVVRELLRSETTAERVAATRALADVNRLGLGRVMASLLEDGDPRVQAACLGVLTTRPVPELTPALIPLMERGELVGAVTDALIAAGPGALDALAQAAAARMPDGAAPVPLPVRERLVGVIGQLGATALPVLGDLARTPESDVRRRAIRAWCGIVAATGAGGALRASAERLAREQVTAAMRARVARERIRSFAGAEFLGFVLEEEQEARLADCFLLLGAARLIADVATVRRRLQDGDADERAGALELLDNILGGNLRQQMLPLLEGSASGATGAGIRDADADAHATVHELMDDGGSEWIAAGAVHACAARGMPACRQRVAGLLASASPRVRETALAGLASHAGLGDARGLVAAAARMVDDPDATVSGLARLLADEPTASEPHESPTTAGTP